MNDIVELAEQVATTMSHLIEESGLEKAREIHFKIPLFIDVIESAKLLIVKLEAEEEASKRRCQEAETNLAEKISAAEEIRKQLQEEKDEHAKRAEEDHKQLQAEKVEYTRKADEYTRKIEEYSTNAVQLASMFERLQLAEDSSAKEAEVARAELLTTKNLWDLEKARHNDTKEQLVQRAEYLAQREEELESARENERSALARVKELEDETERLKRDAKESNTL